MVYNVESIINCSCHEIARQNFMAIIEGRENDVVVINCNCQEIARQNFMAIMGHEVVMEENHNPDM